MIRIGAVLDATAVRRYQAGKDVAVGELIGEITDDNAFVAVPVTALACARAATDDAAEIDMLGVLIANPAVVVWDLGAEEGLPIGATSRVIDGDLSLAQAIHLADQHEAQLATERGERVREVAGDLFGIVDI